MNACDVYSVIPYQGIIMYVNVAILKLVKEFICVLMHVHD